MSRSVAARPLALDDNADPFARLRPAAGWTALAVLIVVLLTLWLPGWRTYPEATSRESLDLIKALYSATSAQNEEWLARVETEIAEAAEEGKMSPRERDAFDRITATARSGEWSAAQQASLRFAEEQLRR
jgi:hypothetical protein